MAGLRLPGRHLVPALGVALARGVSDDWRASPIGRALTPSPRVEGFQVRPRDFRPADPEAGRGILAGGFVLAGVLASADAWLRRVAAR